MSDLVTLSEVDRPDGLPRWAAIVEDDNHRGIGTDSHSYQIYMATDKAFDHPIGRAWTLEADAVAFARALDDDFAISRLETGSDLLDPLLPDSDAREDGAS